MAFHQDPPNSDILSTLFQTTSEKIGGTVAAAAVTSPLWMQQIKPYSDVAAIFVPILGCVYLSMQIGFKLWDRARNDG